MYETPGAGGGEAGEGKHCVVARQLGDEEDSSDAG